MSKIRDNRGIHLQPTCKSLEIAVQRLASAYLADLDLRYLIHRWQTGRDGSLKGEVEVGIEFARPLGRDPAGSRGIDEILDLP